MTFENCRPYEVVWKKGATQILHTGAFFCAVFIEPFVHFPFTIVQRLYARTSKHPMDVRPLTLTPYVQTPYERTPTEPTPYVQRILHRQNWRFMPFYCRFFVLQESRICRSGQLLLLISHSQSVGKYPNESKKQTIRAKRHDSERHSWAASSAINPSLMPY